MAMTIFFAAAVAAAEEDDVVVDAAVEEHAVMLNTDAAAIAVLKILLNVFIVFSPFSMCCVLFVLRLFIRRSSIGSPPVINKKAVFWISPETTLIAVPL
jgi:hypothetical protein